MIYKLVASPNFQYAGEVLQGTPICDFFGDRDTPPLPVFSSVSSGDSSPVGSVPVAPMLSSSDSEVDTPEGSPIGCAGIEEGYPSRMTYHVPSGGFSKPFLSVVLAASNPVLGSVERFVSSPPQQAKDDDGGLKVFLEICYKGGAPLSVDT